MSYNKSLFQSGERNRVIIPDPGAGNEWFTTAQVNKLSELLAVRFTLTTAAGGPSRELLLSLTSTEFPGLIFPIVIPAPVTSGGTFVIAMYRGSDTGTGFTSNGVINVNLPEIFFNPAVTLSSLLIGIQPGDEYTDIIIITRFFNPNA